MSEENKEIGLRIRKMREEKKMSREKLAESANISTQFLADIETGKKGMSVYTLKSLCTALEITADYIVYGTDRNIGEEIEKFISTLDEHKQLKIKEIIRTIVEIV